MINGGRREKTNKPIKMSFNAALLFTVYHSGCVLASSTLPRIPTTKCHRGGYGRIKITDPDTHREIAAGGVRDMTWHGRHAYISRRENARPDRQKWMSSSNGIFEKRKWKFTGLQNDPCSDSYLEKGYEGVRSPFDSL
ncbi:Uncharacterized protein DBV15_09366 [Temnothorax longispinosus]|uniref:Uncharacterized protein n=1 Tax=Temnothorax longispinosus TaxID=300112 RepID=A0A4V3SA96_9HYME|nr:Uncharacterized protein DBV15_09366 [Temnothorax longispinosus]